MKKQWINAWNGTPGGPRPVDYDGLQDLNFPPATYDAYVLIGLGPAPNSHGLIFNAADGFLNPANYGSNYYFHIAGMATYFMATRDANIVNGSTVEGDGALDYEFNARNGDGQAKFEENLFPGTGGPGVDGILVWRSPSAP